MAINTLTFEVVELKLIAPKVRHIALRRADGQSFNFVPGQFITIHFDHQGQHYRRSYSIASAPDGSGVLAFAASYVEHGPGSEFLFSLQLGDQVQVSGPFGRLILRDEAIKRVLLIATGTGVTPYRAMIPHLIEKIQQHHWKVIIMQGAQYRQDLLYPEDFLAFVQKYPEHAEYRAYLSRDHLQDQRVYEHKGYVQSSFDDLHIDPASDVVYLCGNPNMIDDAFAKAQALGMASAQVRREKYISSK